MKCGLLLGLAGLLIVVLLILNGDRESPNKRTGNRLRVLEQALTSYAKEHGSTPETLSELALPEVQLQDHLGEPFTYRVDGTTITLLSYGSDKTPGGGFFKRDHTVTFDVGIQK